MTDLSNVSTADLLASLDSGTAPTQNSAKSATPEKFAQQYGGIAESTGHRLGVDPKALLAQWGLETGWGKSVIPGTNNLGNIKDFSGRGTNAKDNMTGSVDAYRTYDTPDAFAEDFSGLLSRKYKGVLGAGSDINKYAQALKAGGYAEDPNYVAKLQSAYKMVGGGRGPISNVVNTALTAVSGTANAQSQAPSNDLSNVSTADLLASLDNSSAAPQKPKNDASLMSNIGSGIASGVADVGNTLINAASYLPGKVIPGVKNWNDQRNASLQDFNNERSDSTAFNAARIGANIAATLPVGGVLGAGVKLASKAPAAVALADALASGGLRGGNLATRVAGGAGTGAASSALLNPDDAGTGAAIGGALPIIGRAAGAAGNALAGTVSPEVAQLAQKAQGLGIDLRLDQLKESKPLNALSASLDYLPFSGKGAAIQAQQKQFNIALSKTVGENTDNVTQAVKNAETKLGSQFDDVLKNTSVKADDGFQNDLSRIADQAKNEMTDQQYGVLNRQINNILDKVQPGDVIDADAAYNIKKGLDRLSKSNDSTLAYYARDTRNALIDALNRSLPDGGEAFAKTRQQWGNLQELSRLVPNGAEGDISAARLGNARNIRSKDLGDLSDIAAQFLKGRIGDSGTAQRAGIYAGIGGALAPKAALLGMSAGRAANSVLNNKTLVNNAISNALGNSVPQVNNSLMQYLVPAAAAASTSRN